MEVVHIGFDIGGMSIKAGLVDKEGNILYKSTRPTPSGDKGISFIKYMRELIDELIAYSQDNNLKITAIGVAIPGIVDNKEGSLTYANNLDLEYPFNVKEKLKDYGFDFYMSNDANVACLAEQKFGAAKGKKDAILLTLGTGVGGGIVIDNKLYEGNEGKGAELGHFVLVVDGLPCTCGRKGCFEAYASATALLRLTKEIMMENKDSLMWEYCDNDINKVTGLTSFECSKIGDKAANLVVDTYVKYLGEGILNICNVFRPETVIIGGGISNQKDYFINKIVNYCEKYHYGYKNTPKVEIVAAKLTNDAGIIGAAHLLDF